EVDLAMVPQNATSSHSGEKAKKLGISLEDYLLPTHGRIQMISKSGDLLSVEDQGSTAGHEYPMRTQQQLLDGYRQLVIGRRVNDQNYALVRQARMAVYPSSHGQGASEAAAALCLSPTDWLFPTHRDTVAVLARGGDPMQG